MNFAQNLRTGPYSDCPNTGVKTAVGQKVWLWCYTYISSIDLDDDGSATTPAKECSFAGQPKLGTRSTSPATSCVTGASRPSIATNRPVLGITGTDPNGDTLLADFEWFTTAGTKIGGGTSAEFTSGAKGTVTVPAGAFVNGGTYAWRVRVTDGMLYSAWSSKCEFVVNTSPRLGARTTAASPVCVTGSGRPVAGLTPALAATYGYAASATLAVTFEWWPVEGAEALGSATVSGKNATAAATTIPAGQLTDGDSYQWRVKADEGTITSGWSPWCEFTASAEVADMPADKANLLATTANAPTASDLDLDADEPLPATADAGPAADVTAIRSGMETLMESFNQAQRLSPAPATRQAQATRYVGDVTAANTSPGMSAYSASSASSFIAKMSTSLDRTVLDAEATALAQAMQADAADPTLPSLVSSDFQVLEWRGIQVSGSTATAIVLGATTNCFEGGSLVVDASAPEDACTAPDPTQWQVSLRKGDDGQWRMVTFDGYTETPAEEPGQEEPDPSESPEAQAEGQVMAKGYGSRFDGVAAQNWAKANYAKTSKSKPTIPNYKFYGSDCTNFVSAAWNRGGRIPMTNNWHQARWYNNDGYYFEEGSYSFIRVKDFRSRWYDIGSRYVQVGFAKGYDEYAQHSSGKITDWRTWYWKRTSYQRVNMEKSGHGLRIIRP
ncbi:amidase domain-containing protein [Actinoplanes sp. NPDC023714]|uniref:amidase domain-containing protein n=1 Tax=Actinoplanes sp. NPDC023714 TaxID=3154322 RepID=UPI0033C7E2D6